MGDVGGNPGPAAEGTTERRFWCRHYEDCLDVAVAKKWEGFTCEGCGGFERVELSPQEAQLDADLCQGLLVAILHRKITGKHAKRLVQNMANDRYCDEL